MQGKVLSKRINFSLLMIFCT